MKLIGDTINRPKVTKHTGDTDNRPKATKHTSDTINRPKATKRTGDTINRPKPVKLIGGTINRPKATKHTGDTDNRPKAVKLSGGTINRPKATKHTGDTDNLRNDAKYAVKPNGNPVGLFFRRVGSEKLAEARSHYGNGRRADIAADPPGTLDRPRPSRARRREPEISRTKKTLLKTFFTVTVAAAAAY